MTPDPSHAPLPTPIPTTSGNPLDILQDDRWSNAGVWVLASIAFCVLLLALFHDWFDERKA